LRVDFENLNWQELQLLLYCLVLEESVTVTLSQAALGKRSEGPVTLTGPMRHKIGGAKPQGAGSIGIQMERLTLNEDSVARYRHGPQTARRLEEKEPGQGGLSRPMKRSGAPQSEAASVYGLFTAPPDKRRISQWCRLSGHCTLQRFR
jgi:hypothetical protein